MSGLIIIETSETMCTIMVDTDSGTKVSSCPIDEALVRAAIHRIMWSTDTIPF